MGMLNKYSFDLGGLTDFIKVRANDAMHNALSVVRPSVKHDPANGTIQYTMGGTGKQPLANHVSIALDHVREGRATPADKKMLLGTLGTAASVGTMIHRINSGSTIHMVDTDSFYERHPVLRQTSTVAYPIAAYYTMHNLDRPKKGVMGAVATLASAPGALTSMSPTDLALAHGALLSASIATDGAKESETAEELHKLLGQDDVESAAKRINDLTTKTDLRTRYPGVSYMPIGNAVLKHFNKQHIPVAHLTPEQRVDYASAFIARMKREGVDEDTARARFVEKAKNLR